MFLACSSGAMEEIDRKKKWKNEETQQLLHRQSFGPAPWQSK
jgi:hypothetical protein